jgi:hypothetical protein
VEVEGQSLPLALAAAWASFAQPTWSGYTICTDKQNAIVTINFKNVSTGSGGSWTGQLNGSIYVDDLAFM